MLNSGLPFRLSSTRSPTRRWTPSRIDQGVDYSGTGPIDALGPGRVVLVSTDDTGWGNGNGWISYQLTRIPKLGSFRVDW